MGKKKVQIKLDDIPESESDSGIEFSAEPEIESEEKPNPNFNPDGEHCKKCKFRTKTINAKVTTCKGKTDKSGDRLRIIGQCEVCATNKNEFISKAKADKINLS